LALNAAAWPANSVERRRIDELIPYARNARTHSPTQVAQLAASIKEWGWTIPVLVDETGGIIAGHGRILAARQLGIDEIPVMVAGGWTDAQKRAYVIADNKLAMNAGWDEEILALEVAGLVDLSFDPTIAGFTDREISKMIGGGVAIGGDGDESRGVVGDLMSFADYRIQISDDELAILNGLVDRFLEENGGNPAGFAAWLCKGHHVS
jgi:hypothetical protein